jgi:eukaryotic-like serine/threonine-protein kinase
LFSFITRQPFWVNLLAAIALIFLLVFLFLQSLSWITNHGSYLKVPSVIGKNVDEAVKSLEDKGFDVVIIDSVYDDNLPLNVVKRQVPDSGATVKVNRTVFLNINPVSLPMVAMPKLEGLSFRFAVDRLTKNHLHLGDTSYRPDFMKGTILEQDFGGNKIAPGTLIKWGSAVNLVIGGGLSQQQIPVPELYGLTLGDAKAVLSSKGIILAAVLPSGSIGDTMKAYVYKQNPDLVNDEGAPNFIQPGQTMDLWIQASQPPIDSTRILMESDSLKIN